MNNWNPIVEAIDRKHEKLGRGVYWIQWKGGRYLNQLPWVPLAIPATPPNLNPNWWWR